MNAPRSGCPINLTLEALGDRWSLIVIRDLMFGNRRHFCELLTRSEERIASARASLVARSLRRAINSGRRPPVRQWARADYSSEVLAHHSGGPEACLRRHLLDG